MSSSLVKICGIRTAKMAELATLAGADFIGMVFHPDSKRYVTLETAKEIAAITKKNAATPVAIFVNQSAKEMDAICQATGIDVVQLHGEKCSAEASLLPSKYQRIFVKPIDRSQVIRDEDFKDFDPKRDYILLDGKFAGSGQTFDFHSVKYEGHSRLGIAGGLNVSNVRTARDHFNAHFVDASSSLENLSGEKDLHFITRFIHAAKSRGPIGRYDHFGGIYLPELLMAPIQDLQKAYDTVKVDKQFREAFQNLLKHYAGRPTALTEVKRFAKAIKGPRIYLKREDLLHTGAHKLNNALGQCLLASYMGKKRIIAETGAGQHGVATAAAAAHLDLECVVYMGAKDIERQALNVARMKMMGAKVISVNQGSATLKDAVNEALRDWSESYETTHYCLGSALGPHPYPEMVADFQSVIGEECLEQLSIQPNLLVACVGGGSNAIGLFSAYLHLPKVKMIGVEAYGHGKKLGQHAARFQEKTQGVLHGCYTYVLQNAAGQIADTASISAGLDYPAVGPEHAALFESKRVEYVAVHDDEALEALQLLCQTEGILCALESAHALAYLKKIAHTLSKDDTVILNLSGRGDKDLAQIMEKVSV